MDKTKQVAPKEKLIVLADDEEIVRRVCSSGLKDKNFRVLEAENGLKAWDLIKGNPNQVDLLITDIVMPEMTGFELFDAVRAERPDMRVLFLSGSGAASGSREIHFDSKTRFIPKPFRPHQLTTVVEEMLENA
jgi:two-component system, cell cycle sensor histidine kinase and response regulator CckA